MEDIEDECIEDEIIETDPDESLHHPLLDDDGQEPEMDSNINNRDSMRQT